MLSVAAAANAMSNAKGAQTPQVAVSALLGERGANERQTLVLTEMNSTESAIGPTSVRNAHTRDGAPSEPDRWKPPSHSSPGPLPGPCT